MESLSYDYKQIDFKNLMKAQMRKYFDEVYKDKTIILDISRKIINQDTLEIYRVHCFEFFYKTQYMVERILIDRKRKMYQSWINTFQYVEECNYSEYEGGVRYVQKYSVPFFLKSKKEKVFKCGCEVIEKIISSNNLRDRL
jgi:hypothetical protein